MKVKAQLFIIEMNRVEISAIAKLIGGTSEDMRERQFDMTKEESDTAYEIYNKLMEFLGEKK